MRRLRMAIVVSVTSHAVVLGWLVWSGSVLAVPLPSLSTARTPMVPRDEELAVVLLDPGATAAAAAAPEIASTAEPPSKPARHAGMAIETGARASEPARRPAAASDAKSGEPGAADGAPARSPWMTMRHPERPSLDGLSQKFIDDFLARSKPLAPAPDIPDERLSDEIAEARRELRNGHGSLQHIVDLNEQRAHEDLKTAGGGSYRAENRTFTTNVAPDGSVQIEDKPAQKDTQDVLMEKFLHIDSYAHNKLALLDRTRDQRVAVGERHRRVQLAHAAELALRNVERLWAATPDLAGRKRGLFELWDDCAEAGSDEIIAGGTAARGIVIGAIRARLHGPDAYTAAELAALNASRHSKAVFAPYE